MSSFNMKKEWGRNKNGLQWDWLRDYCYGKARDDGGLEQSQDSKERRRQVNEILKREN